MADVRADIIIDVDTSIGIAEIKNLQRQIAQLNSQLLQSGAQQARAAQNIQRNLINNINATEQFSARVKTITSTTESFTRALESNKLSMGQYFKYAGASTKTFGKLFRNEFDTIQKVAESRVKTLQTQYIKLGRDANGALKAIAVRPLALDMENLSTKTALAAQKQQLFNQLIKQGSTNLLNFGKNTQWAGRQLMVGFSVPLAYLGTVASKTFMKMEEQAIRFKRVYGDSFTASSETDKMIKQVQQLASEFTKYGIQVEKTMEMAADAAAMGKMGADLLAQINQATRLAVLGGVEQEQALETTISLTNAFGIAAEELAGKINFLNAVENQTVTAIEDLTIAIPKAAPVIQQLGGDVEDLAFFLTAMKEGGINASEGANALKSGLASLINPTAKASEFLAGFGINLNGIVEANKGNVKGLVVDFAKALDTLDPLNRARSIEQLFGKFQFSRLSTLFQNVIDEGTQANRVLQLTQASSEELAILSERELKRVEDSPMYKFKKAVEDLKVSLVPLGEAFLKAITPLVEFAKGFLDKFNEMGDGAKNFAVIATTVVAGIGPVLLMTFGLIANGVANLIKMFSFISKTMFGAGKASMDLGAQTDYMTQQQLEAAAVASSLDQKHAKLIQTFGIEASAVNNLATAYGRAVANQSKLLGINPETGLPVVKGNKVPKPRKYNTGVVSVPGPKGAGDVVPAMLSPGEAVIPADMSQKYAPLISGMINDSLPGYRFGLNPFANMLSRSRVAVRMPQDYLKQMLAGGKSARYQSAFTTGTGADYLGISGLPNPAQARMRSNAERDVFGLPLDTPASQRPTYGYARTSPFQALLNRIFGFNGRQYNAVTAGKKIGDQGTHYWTNPKTGTYEPNPKYARDTLSRYGDIDIITKRRVGRRSQAFVGDLLMDYNARGGSQVVPPPMRFGPSPMRGATMEQLNRSLFGSRLGNPFGRYQADPINEPRYWTSNPTPPYVETYTPGGFGVGEISKIVAKDRATARELQKIVNQAGLRIRVTPQNAPSVVKMFANMFGTRFSDGGFVDFSGRKFRIKRQADADSILKTIAMLQGNGISDDRILKRMAELSGREITALTATKLAKNFKLTASGKPIDRGAGKSSAPTEIQSLMRKRGTEFESEADFIKNEGKRLGLTESQIRNSSQLHASHLAEIRDAEGRKIWSKNTIVPDLGYINSYLSGFARSADAKKLMSMSTAELKSLGIDKKELIALAGGDHPVTKKSAQTLKAIAEYRGGSFGKLVSAGIDRRLTSGFYNKPLLTLAGTSAADELARLAAAKAQTAETPKKPTSKKKSTTTQTNQPVSMKKLLSVGTQTDQTRPSRATMFSRMFGRNKWAKGVISVPGPKGAGDVVPAMLSPGESVIPAEMTNKYSSLISAMINDKIPGYDGGLFGGSVPTPPNLSGPDDIFARPTEPPAQLSIRDRAANLMGKGIGAAMSGSKLIANSVKTGVTNGFLNMRDNAQIKAQNTLAGKEQGGVYALSRGRIHDPNTGKTYASHDDYVRDHERNQNIKAARQPGTTYVAPNGQVFKFDDAGKARPLTGDAKAAAMAGPETVQPGQRRFSAAGVMRGAAGVAGVGSMAAFALQMGGGPIGEAAGQLAMPLMMLSMVLPLLTSKLGLLAGVAGTVAYVWLSTNAAIDQAREKAVALANTFGTSAESISKYAEFAGNVTGSEIMQKRRENMFNLLPIKPGKTPYGAAFVQSEAGQSIVQNARVAKSRGMNVADALYSQLRDSVLSGAMDVVQARSIASAVSKELKDYKLGVDVQAKISKLFGPGGENLSEGQMISIRVKAIAESIEETQSAIQSAVSAGFADGFNPDDIGTRIGLWAEGWVPDWITGGDQNTEQLQKYQDGLASIAQGYDSVFAGIGTSIDELDATFIQKIEAAKAAGDMKEANALEERWTKQRNKLIAGYKTTVDSIAQTWTSIINRTAAQGGTPTKTLEDLRLSQNTSILSGFEKDSEEYKNAKALLEQFDALKVDGVSIGATQGGFTIKALVDAGALSQSSFQTITELLKSGDIQTTAILDMVTKFGAGQAEKITQVAGLFVDKDGKPNKQLQAKFIAKITTMKVGDAENYLDMFIQASKLGWVVDTQLVITTIFNNAEKSTELLRQMDEISKLDTSKPMTIEYIQKTTQLGDTTMKALQADQEYFESLDPVQQVTYLQTIATLSVAGAGALPDYETWAAENTKTTATGYDRTRGVPTFETKKPDFQAYTTYLANMLTNINKLNDSLNPDTPGGNDDGASKADPFEDILNRLKRIRNAAINAKGGFEELIKAMKKTSATGRLFRGVEQKLLGSGYNREFIDTVMSMDDATRALYVSTENGIVKVTEKGKALQKTLSELALGDFQISVVGDIQDINMQQQAIAKLVGAGMSVGDAFETSQNAQLAYAIATAATTEEVQILVDNFKALEVAQKNLQLSTPEGVQQWLGEQLGEISSAISTVNEYFAAKEAEVNQDFEQGTNLSGRNTAGYNLTQLQSDIDSATASISDYEYQIDDLQYLLDGIEEKEDSINKKYDKRLEALDAVFEANKSIEEQQKSQLDIINALAQGDIAGAARAAAEDQKRRAASAQEAQRKVIEKARETEIAGLRSTNGKTRLQLETQIEELQKKIVKIEEEKLEPAERSVDLAERARDLALEAIGKEGYLGKTATEWGNVENAARLAVVQSKAFGDSIKETLKALPGFTELFDAKGDFAGFKFDPAAYQKWINTNSQQQPVPPYTVVSDENDGKTVNPNQAQIDEYNRLMAITRYRVQKQPGLSEAYKKELMEVNLDRRQKILALGGTPDMAKTIKPTGANYNMGGMVAKRFASGGFAMGTDIVPAMLTPGEFVVRKYAVNDFGVDRLKAINSGTYSGDSVYNYSLSVNVKSDANPDEIARTVMSQIRQVESQRIRGNRL